MANSTDKSTEGTDGWLGRAEDDHASLSYVSTWLEQILRARTLNDAHRLAASLKGTIDGRMNAVKAEIKRLETPDS